MSILDPLPDDSPWYRDHKFLAGKVYEMASRIGELTMELNAVKAERDHFLALAEDDDLWKVAADAWVEQRTKLQAQLAAAEKVVEAAAEVRDGQGEAFGWNQRLFELAAAVDAYRTHEPEETHHG